MPSNLLAVQSFDFFDSTIYALTIGDEPWFKGFEVAQALGYTAPRNAIQMHIDIEDKKDINLKKLLKDQTFAVNQCNYLKNKEFLERTATYINESGVYSLIFNSKLPKAKEFKRWVTSKVLPALRKTGTYSMQSATAPAVQDMYIPVEGLSYIKQMRMLAEKYNFSQNDVFILENIKSKARGQGYGMAMARAEKELRVKLIGLQENVNKLIELRREDAAELKRVADDFYACVIECV